ncbi:hypothetical protein [Streptomyces sp. NBC_00847]|uniref:hypothetical protein n=1 Tax=unclassified Streptomyces TaxID=2593676 RepID=UPI002256CEF0|nr:hypothetical protein [Streptomyces sp. NBC_00847]MCX4883284.1 hypothetical protein [Streptomyces sp. NBC_00847]
MEQRIGSNSQPLKGEPVQGAGFDPAFIPGLTSPASEEPEEAEAQDIESQPEDAGPEGAKTEAAEREPADGDASVDGEEEAPEGPVFEASDRRAKIVADHKGVRLTLDDQECEFRWDEIGAVETESPRFGKRFTITVHTPDRRWYPLEIEATARARFDEWEEQLDAVLDAYFEEGAEEEGTEEEDTAAEATAAEATGAKDTEAEGASEEDAN